MFKFYKFNMVFMACRDYYAAVSAVSESWSLWHMRRIALSPAQREITGLPKVVPLSRFAAEVKGCK